MVAVAVAVAVTVAVVEEEIKLFGNLIYCGQIRNIQQVVKLSFLNLYIPPVFLFQKTRGAFRRLTV